MVMKMQANLGCSSAAVLCFVLPLLHQKLARQEICAGQASCMRVFTRLNTCMQATRTPTHAHAPTHACTRHAQQHSAAHSTFAHMHAFTHTRPHTVLARTPLL